MSGIRHLIGVLDRSYSETVQGYADRLLEGWYNHSIFGAWYDLINGNADWCKNLDWIFVPEGRAEAIRRSEDTAQRVMGAPLVNYQI